MTTADNIGMLVFPYPIYPSKLAVVIIPGRNIFTLYHPQLFGMIHVRCFNLKKQGCKLDQLVTTGPGL